MAAHRYVAKKPHMNGTSSHLMDGSTDLSKADFEKLLKADTTIGEPWVLEVWEPINASETSSTADAKPGRAARASKSSS